MNVLIKANELVHGERQATYGHPLDNHSDIAQMWSVILGVKVKPEQIGLCMIAMKIARHCHKPKTDNLIDIAGYAETVQMIQDERDKRDEKGTM